MIRFAPAAVALPFALWFPALWPVVVLWSAIAAERYIAARFP